MKIIKRVVAGSFNAQNIVTLPLTKMKLGFILIFEGNMLHKRDSPDLGQKEGKSMFFDLLVDFGEWLPDGDIRKLASRCACRGSY